MTVLDVFLNDRKLCRAGVGKDGVLDAIVSWVKLTGAAEKTARRLKQPVEEARLHVGGLRKDVHRTWSARRLEIGDRVAVILTRASMFDPPAREQPQVPRKHRSARQAPRGDEMSRFLNIDLDIVATSPLDSLVAGFGRRVVTLYVGREGRRYGAHLELPLESNEPDLLLRKFVKLVERLPPHSRRLWNQARVREFNVGIQAASKPHSFEIGLAPQTLAAVGRVNARVGVTVYGAGGSS
jgi:hypothetical protein